MKTFLIIYNNVYCKIQGSELDQAISNNISKLESCFKNEKYIVSKDSKFWNSWVKLDNNVRVVCSSSDIQVVLK